MPALFPMIVGESPGKSGESGADVVRGSSRRMVDLCGGARLPWTNLLDEEILPWPRSYAERRAAELMNSKQDALGPWLLLGARVAEAFGIDRGPGEWLQWYKSPQTRAHLVTVPHPSGLNRWWNEPANVAAAEELLTAVAQYRMPRITQTDRDDAE